MVENMSTFIGIFVRFFVLMWCSACYIHCIYENVYYLFISRIRHLRRLIKVCDKAMIWYFKLEICLYQIGSYVLYSSMWIFILFSVSKSHMTHYPFHPNSEKYSTTNTRTRQTRRKSHIPVSVTKLIPNFKTHKANDTFRGSSHAGSAEH